MSKRERILSTYLKVQRAAESVRVRVYSRLAKYNLSESQIEVLEALMNLGPLTQKQLGSKVFKSGGNITMVVDNLEKLGYVIRKRGKPDRRFFTVHLTDKGKEKIKEIFPVIVDVISEELKMLTKSEHNELQRLSKKIGLGAK
jgi:MarR family 2-MHQ and catechol resistance regulon transcriptional repressor